MSLHALVSDSCAVQLFGEFKMIYKGREITSASVRTKKVWLLIQYLIANWNKSVSSKQLISDIWGWKESHDPLNCLKNLVHRARSVLKELCEEETDFILYEKDTYCWNTAIPWEIDTENFEKYILKAEKAHSEPEKIAAYYEAFLLYKGKLLPKSAYCSWIFERSSYYATLFTTCTYKLCRLLEQYKQFDQIVFLCESAADIHEHEEKLHEQLLKGYIALGRFDKALSHYHYISDLFYGGAEAGLSDPIKALYPKITGGLQTEPSISRNLPSKEADNDLSSPDPEQRQL